MSAGSVSVAHTHRGNAATILLAGAAVGVLDGLFAIVLRVFVYRSGTAEQVFQGIARGLIGPAALQGGHASALLGLVLHFTIATIWASVFWVAVGQFAGLRRMLQTTAGTIAVGALFGAFVWLVMRFGVIPAAGLGGRTVQIRQFLVMFDRAHGGGRAADCVDHRAPGARGGSAGQRVSESRVRSD
jgi:hypothetical protein